MELYGWLAFKRVGSKFLVLRDAYGKVQARISPERMDALQSLLPHLNCESSLRVKGRVMDRGEGNRNKRMATGDVEVRIRGGTGNVSGAPFCNSGLLGRSGRVGGAW